MSKVIQHQTHHNQEAPRASLNAVMRHGGVTLQSICWKSVTKRQYPDTKCSLPLTLDLLSHKALGETSRQLISQALPSHVQPILIYGACPLVSPALEIETLDQIINSGNSVGVEPQLHTIRVNSKHQRHQSDADHKSFDTILFCSGVAIGDRPLIIGAAFLGEDDRDDLVRDAVRQALRQLCADQIVLTDIVERCQQLPHLARVLIDTENGDIIWRNQVAVSQWELHSSLLSYLAETRSQVNVPTTAHNDITSQETANSRSLTLVTFLRSELGQEHVTPFAQNFDIGDKVRTRLSSAIEAALSGNSLSVGDSLDDHGRTSQTNEKGLTQMTTEQTHSKIDSTGGSTKSSSESIQSETIQSEEQAPFAEAHKALEIALRHLPTGGRIKLSPIDDQGVVRLRSYNKDGEETVDITLKDKHFPDGDEVL